MKYIIIGGVAGGATAAARIRRNTEKAEIILFEKGEYISYANCGLPYYIGGVIEDRERLFVQTPESFGKRFNIDIRTRSEVTAIDVKKKEVTVRSSGKTYTESYDKLLLSPGASPVRPPLPGIDTEGIFTLRNVNDTDRIKSYMQQKAVKRAVIVGGGFIGLEMAENLHHSGIEVSVVEMANQVMGPIDYSMASLVHEHLQQKGVRLYLEQAVESFEKTAEGISVHFKSGIQVNAEMVLLSIGVRAETRLATEAGLKLGEMRGIYVNEYLQTSDESVYAVGDAIEFPHPITHKPWLNFLAGPANRQARIVADNMVFGNKIKYEGSIGTAIAKVFDLTVASTGLPAKRLKQMNIPYLSATIHSNSHAGYYPGASMLDIKITFSPTDGKLYGAQIVGYDGVDKRIDEYALTIKRNGTVYDLTELEHAYAPPFSSAKDPVALSGYVAGNILSGKMTPLYWRELQQADLKKVTLVDVRTADEYSLGKIPGAINVPLDELRERMNEIPSDKPIFVYCGVGLRGYLASCILKDNGYQDVRNLIGGIKTYKAATTPVCLPEQPSSSCQPMPVLTFHQEFSFCRNGNHIDPVGVFQYIIFIVHHPIRQAYTVTTCCQPRTANQIFTVENLPFFIIFFIHLISILNVKPETDVLLHQRHRATRFQNLSSDKSGLPWNFVRSRLSCPGIYRVRQSLSVCYHILFSVPVELQTAFQSVHHSIP